MNLDIWGRLVIKYLMVALGLGWSVLGGLFLENSYSQAAELSINLINALSIFMVCAGISFCFIGFRIVK
ncbi:hypothetical protein [Paraglaciecola sp. 2405UD69-4]|uniref:hypothetical protein n=1 Tax=Paraglaciecola sp. 2405UD69-4 TaxID=3391836 RepID=UPI0039C9C079